MNPITCLEIANERLIGIEYASDELAAKGFREGEIKAALFAAAIKLKLDELWQTGLPPEQREREIVDFTKKWWQEMEL